MKLKRWQIVQTVLLLIIGIPFLINFPDVTKTHEILMLAICAWVIISVIKQNYKFMKSNIWKPTPQLRWKTCTTQSPYSTRVKRSDKKTLQQLWVDDDGNEEWRDIPTGN